MEYKGISLGDSDSKHLKETAEELNPKVIVEIGSRYGDSSEILGKIVKSNNGILYCIEPTPQPQWFSRMREEELLNNVRMVNTLSPWVQPLILPSSFDYLFIDGDHRTINCIADYFFFAPFVRMGGRIAIHDMGQPECKEAINRAVDIIKIEATNIKCVVEDLTNPGIIVFEKIGDGLKGS